MLLMIILLVTIAIALATYIILGKAEIKSLAGTLTLLFFINFIFLYAKFGASTNIIMNVLKLLGLILTVVLFIILLVKLLRKTPEKAIKGKKRIVLLANVLVLVVIMLLPSLGVDGRYKVYNKAYTQTTEALIKAHKDTDSGEKGERYMLSLESDLKALEKKTSKKTVDNLKTLRSRTGVEAVIIDDQAVYFQFGSFLQTVDGIVVFKDLKGASPDPTFIDHYIQSPTFKKIQTNVYYYDGGL